MMETDTLGPGRGSDLEGYRSGTVDWPPLLSESPVDEALHAVVARTAARMAATTSWATVWIATFTVFGYLVRTWGDGTTYGQIAGIGDRLGAVLFGLAEGLLLWAIGAALSNASVLPGRANPTSYVQLRLRLADARARLTDLTGTRLSGLERRSLWARWLTLRDRLGTSYPQEDWSSGEAYVASWRELHSLEEAVIEHEETDRLDAVLMHDRMRVQGSALDAKDSVVRGQILHAATLMQKPDSAESAGLRPILRSIRTAVDDYRDRRLDALVRGRKEIDQVSVLLGTAAWALLALAIITGATPQAVAWVSAVYLVGVGAGLLSQLRASKAAASREDVFGYGKAHLRRIVLVSGLAAVGGVFLVAVVGNGIAEQQITALGVEGLMTPGSLLMAAAFGLAPSTFLDRLDAWAKTNLEELEATRPGGESATSTPA